MKFTKPTLYHLSTILLMIPQNIFGIGQEETCSDVPSWLDKNGYSCPFYEAYSVNCRQSFVNKWENNGYDASTACCYCEDQDLEELSTVTDAPTLERGTCFDFTDWADSNGVTCATYQEYSISCLSQFVGENGYTVSTACCHCGGGYYTQRPSEIPSLIPSIFPSMYPTVSSNPSLSPSISMLPTRSLLPSSSPTDTRPTSVEKRFTSTLGITTESTNTEGAGIVLKTLLEQKLTGSSSSSKKKEGNNNLSFSDFTVEILNTTCTGTLCLVEFDIIAEIDCEGPCTPDVLESIEDTYVTSFSSALLEVVTDDSFAESFNQVAGSLGYYELQDVTGIGFTAPEEEEEEEEEVESEDEDVTDDTDDGCCCECECEKAEAASLLLTLKSKLLVQDNATK